MPPEHHVNVHVLGTVAVFTPPAHTAQNSRVNTDKAELQRLLATTAEFRVTRVVEGGLSI